MPYSGRSSRVLPRSNFEREHGRGQPRGFRPRPPARDGDRNNLHHPGVAERVPHAQRPEPVAGAGDLPDPEGVISPRFRSDRADHPGVPVDRVDAATGGRHGDGQAATALLLAGGHVLQPGRLAAAVRGVQLRRDPVRRGAGRDRLVSVPSRVVARGADGLWRALWFCAVAVPGGRQYRIGDRAATGGLHRGAARTRQHCLVLGRGLAGDGAADACRILVQSTPRDGRTARTPGGGAGRGLLGFAARNCRDRFQHPAGAAVLQERLYLQPELLLYVLPDR